MHDELFKKINKIKKTDKFLITITVYSEKKGQEDKLDTFLLTNKFPFEELEGTSKMISKLIKGAKGSGK